MTVFTEEQMHRPLFEEPTVEIERPDEWSEPLGFLVGGAANQRYQHLGQQYFHAANHLVECIKHQDVADCEVANPVLYLYRHSIELFLKSIMKGAPKPIASIRWLRNIGPSSKSSLMQFAPSG